jgi:hypothetical protein
VVFLLFDLLRFSVGFKIRAIAAIVFSVENEAAFEAGARDGGYEEEGNETFEAAHAL